MKKKLLVASAASFFTGYVISNLQFAYAEGVFTRANHLLKGQTNVDTHNLVEVIKYLVDGLSVAEKDMPLVIRGMRDAGYRDVDIADRLGISYEAVRLAKEPSTKDLVQDSMAFPKFSEDQKPLIVDVENGRWEAFAQNDPPTPQDRVLHGILEAVGGVSMNVPPGRYVFIVEGIGTGAPEITIRFVPLPVAQEMGWA